MPSDTKRKLVTTFQKWVLNPVTKLVAGNLPGWVLLETKGRVSGKPRRVPVGGTLDGDTFWIVAEHGRKADYVRNIEREPKVRIKMRGRWRAGRAQTVPGDDARARVKQQGAWNRGGVQLFGSDLLTVRVDLEGDVTARSG